MSSHKINDTGIKTPHRFQVQTYDIKNEDVLAGGKRVIDIIATKKRFSLAWVDMTGSELDSLLTLMDAEVFFDYTYPTETGENTVTVSRGPVDRELFINYNGKRYRGVGVELLEQ